MDKSDTIAENARKQLAWEAYKEAWNQKGSMDHMTDLEIRTAKQHFENWWQGINNE